MKKQPSVWICILLDAVGSISYIIPVVGEWTDIVWAPFSAFLFYKLFGGRLGKTGAVISFIEEALPFIDFIPTFTIAYFYNKISGEK